MLLPSLPPSAAASTAPAHELGSAELQVPPTCPPPSMALLLSHVSGAHHRGVEVGREPLEVIQ